jgi:ppGpp synthetase/RelA/SpoT-type nucleotidyltranferase
MVDAADTPEFSKNQVDRLGDRLRRGDISENDLRLLDTYRRSFTQAYEDVVGRITSELGLEPTGRPAKSTTSIIDKLQRETVRLGQMQDIAGCRIVVPLLAAQDEVIHRLKLLFDRVDFDDRRKNPSHGYRQFTLL